MRALLLVCLSPLALSLACGPGAEEVCGGLPAALPTADEVPDGTGSAQLDGAAFTGPASWAPGPNSSLDISTLSIIIAYDESGTETTDLIGRGAFPICVPVGERSPTVSAATYDGPYITNAEHTGMLAILDEQGGVLVGRFEIDLVENNTGDEITFSDGAFRAERR